MFPRRVRKSEFGSRGEVQGDGGQSPGHAGDGVGDIFFRHSEAAYHTTPSPRAPHPSGALPPNPRSFALGPGLSHRQTRSPAPHCVRHGAVYCEAQPLDWCTAPVALQQSRILCVSNPLIASLRSRSRPKSALSCFECYKPSCFDRTAT